MSKPKVNVRIDGLFLLVAGSAALFYMNRGKLLNKINPNSHENIIYQSVEGETLTTISDHAFAAIDLMNPWNESDAYAEQVWSD